MKKLLLICGFAIGLRAQTLQSISLTGSGTAPITAYPSATQRWEWRGTLPSLPVASDTNVVRFDPGGTPNYFRCTLLAGSSDMTCRHQNDSAPGGTPTISLAGRTDIRVRYQHYLTANTSSIEVWNGDCTNYNSVTRTTGNQGTPNLTGTFFLGDNTQVFGTFRADSTVIPIPSACPFDSNVPAADLMDFRFEGGTPYASTAGSPAYTLTAAGSSIIASIAYPPLASISIGSGFAAVSRAGTSQTFSGANSRTFRGTEAPASYTWAQASGPSGVPVGTFSSPTAASTQFTPTIAGGYSVRLTVTDSSGAIASATQEVGAVASDATGIVITPGGDSDIILGPVTRLGVNPWPWEDSAAVRGADVLLPYQTRTMDADNTPVIGTATITSSAPNSLDQGFICCQPVVTVTGFSPSATLTDLQFVWLHYDRDGDGSFRGRASVTVETGSRTATTFKVKDFYWKFPPSQSISMPVTTLKAGSPFINMTYFGEPLTGSNYYDAIVGNLRTWRRTGIQRYYDQAMVACDLWRVWAFQGGFTPGPNRNKGWHSMMACAANGYSAAAQLWNEIDNGLKNSGNSQFSPPTPRTVGAQDVREQAFLTRATALMTMVYPTKTGDPAATRATYCTALTNQINNQWLATKTDIGGTYTYWSENLYLLNASYPAAGNPPVTGPYGTSPWRSSSLTMLALKYAHQALGPSHCNNPTLAATVLQTITNAANFAWDYARKDNGVFDGAGKKAVWYNVQFAGAQGEDATRAPVVGTGTVSATNGSTTVTGVGTSFLTLFAPGDGTTYIGIASPGSTRNVYRVTSVASNTQLTINTPYIDTTGSSLAFIKGSQATSACGALSIAAFCEEPINYSSKVLVGDMMGIYGWLFSATGNTLWRDRADWWGGATMGGSDLGTGVDGTGTGPESDGTPANMDSLLPACGAQPCTQSARSRGVAVDQGKFYGLVVGAGDTDSAIAYRYGVSSPTLASRILNYAPAPPATTSTVCRIIFASGQFADWPGSGGSCTGNIDTRIPTVGWQIRHTGAAGLIVAGQTLALTF